MSQSKLGARLKAARLAQGLTLRQVEDLSDGGISNPYLCHIEQGVVAEVMPVKLRTLARVLKLNFLELMILAGHLTVKDLKGKV